MTLQFVLQYFQAGRLNPEAAIRRFRSAIGLGKRILWQPFVGTAAAIIIGLFLLYHYHNVRKEYLAYDVVQSFTLPDGSKVTLAPGSTLSLQPHKTPRHVDMSGLVMFNVAHDEKHPFVVSGTDVDVEVLGTVFSVWESPGGTRVDVTEGHVRASAKDGPATELFAGESAQLTDGLWRNDKPTPNPMVWATGRFVYDAVPLADVLAELSAYYGEAIDIPDTDKQLSAEFSSDMALKDILDMISLALDIKLK